MAIEIEQLQQENEVANFHRNLEWMRRKRGLSYASLGMRSGMTERNAYMICTGKQGARVGTVVNLALALQIYTRTRDQQLKDLVDRF